MFSLECPMINLVTAAISNNTAVKFSFIILLDKRKKKKDGSASPVLS